MAAIRGDKVRELRREKLLSQAELSAATLRLGNRVSDATIKRIESSEGPYVARTAVVRGLAEALGVDPNKLRSD